MSDFLSAKVYGGKYIVLTACIKKKKGLKFSGKYFHLKNVARGN